jgi:hypothetical protein
MSVFRKTATLRTGDFTRLHTAVSRPLRLTIDTINGEPPSPAGFIPELQALVGGVAARVTGGFQITMTRLQCIPVGIVRGRVLGLRRRNPRHRLYGTHRPGCVSAGRRRRLTQPRGRKRFEIGNAMSRMGRSPSCATAGARYIEQRSTICQR